MARSSTPRGSPGEHSSRPGPGSVDLAPARSKQSGPDGSPAGGPGADTGFPDSTPGAPVPDPFEDAEALEELGERITTLAAHIAAAEHRFLLLLVDFDRRQGWKLGGYRSCVDFLVHRASMNRRTAQDRVRTARALVGLPRISEAMGRGELSYSKARCLTRVAKPESEEELLELGRSLATDQLEKTIRSWRKHSAATEEQLAEEIHRNRRLSIFPDEDGRHEMWGMLTPEQGAQVMRAIEAASDALFRGPQREETTPRQRRADALVLLAQRALAAGFGVAEGEGEGARSPERRHEKGSRRANGVAGLHGTAESNGTAGSNGASRPNGTGPVVSGATAERYLVFLHLEPDTLDPEAEPGRSHLEDGTRISAEAARRIACDTSVVNVVRGEHGEVLDVGRKYRTTHPALRRALEIRDRGCRFPGCSVRFTQAHHVTHWADGGRTERANCLLLCNFHHRLVHEGGWEVLLNRSDESAIFVDPRGGWHMTRRPGPSLAADEEGREAKKEVGEDIRRTGPAEAMSPSGRAPREGAGPRAAKRRGEGDREPNRSDPGALRTTLPGGSPDDLVRDNGRRGVDPDGWRLTPRYRGEGDIPWEMYTAALEAFNETHFR